MRGARAAGQSDPCEATREELSTALIFGWTAFFAMAIFARAPFAVSLPLVLSACGGSSASISNTSEVGSNRDGTALFAVSGSATPDPIFGVWEVLSAAGLGTDLRFRFAAASAEFATRCNAGTVDELVADVSVGARVSNSEIDLLEAKTDVRTQNEDGRTLSCSTATSMASTPKCDASSGQNRSCFELSRTALPIYDDRGSAKAATKISD